MHQYPLFSLYIRYNRGMRKGTNLLIMTGIFSMILMLGIVRFSIWIALKLRAKFGLLTEIEEMLKQKLHP